MQQFHRQKRKRVKNKTIEKVVYTILTNCLYTPPTKRELKMFMLFLQKYDKFNMLGFKIYNLKKVLEQPFEIHKELYNYYSLQN